MPTWVHTKSLETFNGFYWSWKTVKLQWKNFKGKTVFIFNRSHYPEKASALTLSGPGGAQRPGWPNSQLPIRNLLSYNAQTWWLLVFILETPFGHILAKLVNQGGCCCSFLIKTSQKFWKWKIFPMLENCWNWHGGVNFGSRRTILDIKTHFF